MAAELKPVRPPPTPDGGASSAFPDPRELIDASRVRPRGFRFASPATLLAFVALGLWSAPSTGESAAWLAGARAAATLALAIAFVVARVVARGARREGAAESAAVTALEELVQLRRWPEAADLARRVLSRPMAQPAARAAALASLAGVLARYHRFDDARAVHEELLASDEADPTLAHSIRVARAMTMLREDHLVDADRAMSDLRREVNQARDAVRRAHGNEAATTVRSAGLVLLELYRDVKTGHFAEAIEGFERGIGHLPAALGVRVADVHVLVAAAYDRLGRADDAARSYANATTLAPAVELHRRYPETAGLAGRFAATVWPT